MAIAGPVVSPVQVGERCCDVVQQLLQEHARLKINDSDISTAQRIGNKSKNHIPDKINIIVKLRKRSVKSEMFGA